MELLIGCGNRRDRILIPPERPDEWEQLVVSDINPKHERPDDYRFDEWDLEKLPWPWDDNTFDEVHAYEVMEHLGRQGDYRSFFAHFYEIWRILKPGGWFCGTSPALSSNWLWGDPGHTRIISLESLAFLCQRNYEDQVDKASTPMTDYRFCWKGDFETSTTLAQNVGKDPKRAVFVYMLRAKK